MVEQPESAMDREMHEAPRVLAALAGQLLADGGAHFRAQAPLWRTFESAHRLLWAACGSSRHACLLGKYALAALAELPSQVEQAHELAHFGAAVWQSQALCVAISQSGETSDTLEATSLASHHRCPVFAIANVANSTLMRTAQYQLDVGAGPEIAVPATKSFLAQGLAALALAWAIGLAKGAAGARMAALHQALLDLSGHVASVQQATRPRGDQAPAAHRAAGWLASARQAVFVGRGPAVVAAQESALKLQESAYVPARGMALGEIKHGPMAMLEPDQDILVALVGPGDAARNQLGIERLLALGPKTVLVGAAGDPLVAQLAGLASQATVLTTPATDPLAWPLLATTFGQRLALDCAHARGVAVDAPRYLVKQITTL